MINIDMWYEDKKEQATRLDIYFNDLGCFYTGNIYIFGEIAGDYYADSIPTFSGSNQQCIELNRTVDNMKTIILTDREASQINSYLELTSGRISEELKLREQL